MQTTFLAGLRFLLAGLRFLLAGLRSHTDAPLRSDLDATYENQRLGTGYQSIQATKPQTLAYGLTDSPVGLLAWQLEKWVAWTDADWALRHPDEILTNVMIYW